MLEILQEMQILPFNWVNNTYIGWFSLPFVARRGSIQRNFNVVNDTAVNTLWVSNNNTTLSKTLQRGVVTNLSTSSRGNNYQALLALSDPGFMGLALTNQHTQAGLGANIPMYSISKFFVNSPNFISAASIEDYASLHNYNFRMLAKTATAGPYATIEQYVCAGPDFSLLWFLNVPVVYWASISVNPPSSL